jgi:hypothetical protein
MLGSCGGAQRPLRRHIGSIDAEFERGAIVLARNFCRGACVRCHEEGQHAQSGFAAIDDVPGFMGSMKLVFDQSQEA